MLAVEVDGGQLAARRRRHASGWQTTVKLRAAVTLGWRVLRFTSGEVTSDPLSCIDEVVTNLEQTLDKP